MKYILQGDEREVSKVVRENRIRVERGLIELVPVNEEISQEPPVDDENLNNGEGEDTPLSDDVKKTLLEPLNDKKDVSFPDKKGKKEVKPKGDKPKSE